MPGKLGNLFFDLDTSNIIDDFASPSKPTHNGIDIGIAQGIDKGSTILAPEALKNVVAAFSTSNGNYLKGTSLDGKRTYIFLHMDELPSPGDRQKGSVIGFVGNTGQVVNGNNHLHLSIVTTDQEVQRLGLTKVIQAQPGYKYISFKELSEKI